MARKGRPRDLTPKEETIVMQLWRSRKLRAGAIAEKFFVDARHVQRIARRRELELGLVPTPKRRYNRTDAPIIETVNHHG